MHDIDNSSTGDFQPGKPDSRLEVNFLMMPDALIEYTNIANDPTRDHPETPDPPENVIVVWLVDRIGSTPWEQDADFMMNVQDLGHHLIPERCHDIGIV